MAEPVTFRAHPDLVATLDRAATELDTSVSELVRRALADYLDAHGYGRPATHPARPRRGEKLAS